MAQATAERDTLTASVVNNQGSRTLGTMTLQAVPEGDHQDQAHDAQVIRLVIPHPDAPTAEEVAAKKARRRLSGMAQNRDAHGVQRAHYFNEAGFDVWGYDDRGNYDPAQDTMRRAEDQRHIPTLPNPFTH